MPQDTGEFGFPIKPYDPGKNALQEMSEALDRQEKREEQYENGPMNMNPTDWQQESQDWRAIRNGQKLLERFDFTTCPDDFFPKQR